MASPQAITAVIRAACPTFRNNHDRLAFAVHAAILSSGYRLVAVGEEAERAEGLPADAPEVPVTGWDSSSGEQYIFAYLPDAEPSSSGTAGSSSTQPLLVKALVLGDTLLVSLAKLGAEGPPPEVLELDVNRYTTSDTSSIAKSFANLDELSRRITWALQALEPETPAGTSKPQQAAGMGTKTDKAGAGTKTGDRQQPRSELEAGPRPERAGERRPERVDEFTPARPFFDMDPLIGGRPRMSFPEEGPFPHPLRAGEEDIMPPGGGFAPPSILPGPRPGGGIPGPFPGGGMQVGPHHPIFSGGNRTPPAAPGGARWDPIRPQGLEGWGPDDFVQGGPGGPGQPRGPPFHPDVGPPPAGGGANIDDMYG